MSNEYAVLIGLGIQTILFLGGGYAMVLRNSWSNEAIKEEMKGVKLELKGLAEIIVQMAVQTTRLDNLTQNFTMLQQTVEDLRRGAGWMKKRNVIDGEYP